MKLFANLAFGAAGHGKSATTIRSARKLNYSLLRSSFGSLRVLFLNREFAPIGLDLTVIPEPWLMSNHTGPLSAPWRSATFAGAVPTAEGWRA